MTLISTRMALGTGSLCLICAGFVFSQQPRSRLEELERKARSALESGQYAEAETAFEALSELEPKVAEVHANLGAIYFQEAKYEQAAAQLREAVKLKPTLVKSAGLLALSLAELGRYAEALPRLQKDFQETGNTGFRRLCGLQLLSAFTYLQRDADAVTTALKLHEQYPKDPEVLYHVSKIFGNFAYLTILQLDKAAPNSPWRHLAIAEAFESEGATDRAITEYQTVLAIDPSRPGVHYRIGRTLLAASHQRGQNTDVLNALQEFLAEIAVDQTNGNAAYEVAEIYRRRGILEQARKYYEMALAHYPEFIAAHQGLAAVLISEQQPADALTHLRKAIALNGGDEVSWWRAAQAERALRNFAEQKKALIEYKRLRLAKEEQAQPRRTSPTPEVTQQKVDDDDMH